MNNKKNRKERFMYDGRLPLLDIIVTIVLDIVFWLRDLIEIFKGK